MSHAKKSAKAAVKAVSAAVDRIADSVDTRSVSPATASGSWSALAGVRKVGKKRLFGGLIGTTAVVLTAMRNWLWESAQHVLQILTAEEIAQPPFILWLSAHRLSIGAVMIVVATTAITAWFFHRRLVAQQHIWSDERSELTSEVLDLRWQLEQAHRRIAETERFGAIITSLRSVLDKMQKADNAEVG